MTQDWIIGGTCAFAAVLVVVRRLVGSVRGKVKFFDPVGPVNFDFSKSFASTMTALGALLTTILAAKDIVTSKTPHLPAASYAALSLFFGILVVVAPFVYRVLSKTTEVVHKGSEADIQYQGYAGGFLLAVWLTVWAVYGQLATMFFFLTDMQSSTFFECALGVVFGVSALLLLYYVWTVVPDILEIKVTGTGPATSRAQRAAAGPADAAEKKPQLRTWSAL